MKLKAVFGTVRVNVVSHCHCPARRKIESSLRTAALKEVRVRYFCVSPSFVRDKLIFKTILASAANFSP